MKWPENFAIVLCALIVAFAVGAIFRATGFPDVGQYELGALGGAAALFIIFCFIEAR
jgi:hypothetical protein